MAHLEPSAKTQSKMKAKETAYLTVAVVFRTVAVLVALYGLFIVGVTFLATGAGGAVIALPTLGPCFGIAIVLWFLSKPIAALVVTGLGDDPKS